MFACCLDVHLRRGLIQEGEIENELFTRSLGVLRFTRRRRRELPSPRRCRPPPRANLDGGGARRTLARAKIWRRITFARSGVAAAGFSVVVGGTLCDRSTTGAIVHVVELACIGRPPPPMHTTRT